MHARETHSCMMCLDRPGIKKGHGRIPGLVAYRRRRQEITVAPLIIPLREEVRRRRTGNKIQHGGDRDVITTTDVGQLQMT